MRILAMCFALLIAATPLSAQVNGRLSGTVVDTNGNPVPAAKISLALQDSTTAALATTSTEAGIFSLTGVRPESYNVTVEAQGFQPYALRDVAIYAAQETVLPTITLSVRPLTIQVDVSEILQSVQTANAEAAMTITIDQVRRLPVPDRNPMSLIQTQAGVAGGTINGQRTSSANVTLDGINIQDNFVRNVLAFTPNVLALDQISELTLTTSNASAAMGGGSSHISLVTPSGTNQFHGTAYFQNRNNALAANSWFNNKDGVEKPSFNQNQVGGSLGGPIRRDRLFFYGNYEAYRLPTEGNPINTILTGDARNGIFTYEAGGQVRRVNVLQAAGVTADPVMQQILATVPGPENINNFQAGDSRESLLRNTAGYKFLRKGHHNRDNVTGKVDYLLSTANVLSGSFLWNRQDVTRSGLSNDFSETPKVRNNDKRKLFSAGWRWNPLSSFTNELRGGFNLAPITFSTSESFPDRIIANMVYSNPVDLFRAQGRKTDTYNLLDNAAYIRGSHSFQFGFQTQRIRVEDSSDTGITPTYFVGVNFATPSLSAQQLPGISAADLTSANNLLATLAGFVTGYSQSFNVTSRTSGFVEGAPSVRNYSLDNYAFYLQDTWKIARRWSLNIGLRYELPSIVEEENSLALLPVLENNDPVTTLLSNATLDFAGSAVGRPFYKKDRNNFAPNVGLAWDVFGDGTTSFRAGYNLSYVNDETIYAIATNFSNEGLSAFASRTGLNSRASALPPIVAPTFAVPRTFRDNYLQNAFTAFGMPDPDLRTPYVQQWQIGFQREIKKTLVEIRYVGNHSSKLFRSFDVNPEITIENGFLDDFKRAQRNGNLALAATGIFDPSFNPSITGSQQLTVFPNLVSGGLLANNFVRNTIQTGQAGELAFQYFVNGLNGSVGFYRNPFSLASLLLSNHSHATYNALQLDVVRRFQNGLQFQTNYTYGKVLSDTDGTALTRFQEFRNPRNGQIDRARPSFDLTHSIKANAVYDLPIGRDDRAYFGLLSGWTVSGIMEWRSGNPFSILSGRGTLLRSFRSGDNTAESPLTKEQLDDILSFRMTENGPYIVDASAIGSDGRGVSADGTAPFSGQVFFNPQPGDIGGLQRRWFSGPWVFDFDLAVLKRIRLRDSQSIEFRAEAINVLNHPEWLIDNQNINSVSFGRISSTANSPRRIQLSLHYRF